MYEPTPCNAALSWGGGCQLAPGHSGAHGINLGETPADVRHRLVRRHIAAFRRANLTAHPVDARPTGDCSRLRGERWMEADGRLWCASPEPWRGSAWQPCHHTAAPAAPTAPSIGWTQTSGCEAPAASGCVHPIGCEHYS
jgi:hypothetical protein